jgi:cell division transport system permease protein
MKSVKNHILFILPLLAILLGIESFMVFGRVTASFGEDLRQGYTILVVTDQNTTPETLRSVHPRISRVTPLEKETIVEQIARGIPNTTTDEIIQALPQFYTLHLDRYLDTDEIETIRTLLRQLPGVRRVETFGRSHNANYNLYMLIKTTLWVFVGFMVLTSLFLVLKQMEIWQLEHRERMQVMEILGASAMLRSGVLFRIALIDALIAAMVTIGLFAFLRYVWAPKSGIAFLVERSDLLFRWQDVAVLGGTVLAIVLISVIVVVRSAGETRQG